MKHIKTPITVGKGMLFEPDRQGLPVPLADIYSKGTLSGKTEAAREIAIAVNYHDRMKMICTQLVQAERIANEHEDFTMLVNVTESARDLLAEMEATE